MGGVVHNLCIVSFEADACVPNLNECDFLETDMKIFN